MNIFHFSAECYPAAKVGGLADVVGSLPKYLCRQGAEPLVVIPKYYTHWVKHQEWEKIYSGKADLGSDEFAFKVEREKEDALGFPFFVIDIPGRFDRPGVYGDAETNTGYADEAERFFSFQIAALEWLKMRNEKPDIIHCHDHHTALLPFMMQQCYVYEQLKDIPTIVTVHNAEYQGKYSYAKQDLIPDFNPLKTGLLDWDGNLNSLAAGLKCCWRISTVSPTYMDELKHESYGLESLFNHEERKSQGILNGIDESIWDPEADPNLAHPFGIKNLRAGKYTNKKELCDRFGLNPERPLVAFIGRLVSQKGADLLPEVFASLIKKGAEASFIVLGTGAPELHKQFRRMSNQFVGFFEASLNYNEKLAHKIYAGSDFMIIPSRFEPCGLNQMYSMRYGTIPVVREVGGLKDTVIDVSKPGGYGITFQEFSADAARKALERALQIYTDEKKNYALRKKIMKLDFSWDASAQKYITMYRQLLS